MSTHVVPVRTYLLVFAALMTEWRRAGQLQTRERLTPCRYPIIPSAFGSQIDSDGQ